MEATAAAPRSLRHVDDQHLVTRIGAGHARAVVELVRRYDEIRILPEAYRILGNWADAEEVRSELVARLLALSMKRDHELQAGWPPADVPAWLATVVRRLAVGKRGTWWVRKVGHATSFSVAWAQAVIRALWVSQKVGANNGDDMDAEATRTCEA